MSKVNTAKQRMLEGKPALGAVLLFGSDLSAADMGKVGFDFLLLDIQHGGWDLDTAGRAMRALSGSSSIPMARIAHNNPFAIGSILDRGALGIVVPMVNSAEEARAVVAAAHFQPRGSRSAGSYLASFYGAESDYEVWIERELFLAVQIESAQALEAAEEIMAVDGIDGCWIGPADLSYSLGIDRRTEQGKQQLERAAQRVLDACRNTNKIPGTLAPYDAPHWIEMGFRFVTIGDEKSYMQAGAAAALEKSRAVAIR
jgi:4-hydroxy-2-oxoheptanedioate aldolase